MLLALAVGLFATAGPLGPFPQVLVDEPTGLQIKIPASWTYFDRTNWINYYGRHFGGFMPGKPIFLAEMGEFMNKKGEMVIPDRHLPSMEILERFPSEDDPQNRSKEESSLLGPRFSTEKIGDYTWQYKAFQDRHQSDYKIITCLATSPFGPSIYVTFYNSTLAKKGHEADWRTFLAAMKFVKPTKPEPEFW